MDYRIVRFYKAIPRHQKEKNKEQTNMCEKFDTYNLPKAQFRSFLVVVYSKFANEVVLIHLFHSISFNSIQNFHYL